MIESLRDKLLAERRRNLVQEMEIRKEMGDAMLQQLMESEELRRSFSLHLVSPLGSFFTIMLLMELKCLVSRLKS